MTECEAKHILDAIAKHYMDNAVFQFSCADPNDDLEMVQ